LLLALVFGFATNTWATSSQALWQHGMCQLAIILSLTHVQRFLETGRGAACALAGFFAALSVAVRPTSLLFLAVSLFVLLSVAGDRAKVLASYAGPGLLVGTVLAACNLSVFGNLTGGYAAVPPATDFLSGLAGITVSPSHGLVVYSPVLLFALPGLLLSLRRPVVCRALFMISAGFFASLLVLYANFALWHGGTCYGPRYLTDAVPGLVLLLVPLLSPLKRHPALSTSFAVAAVLSVAVQIVGAFCYAPNITPERPLWDWRNNPIVVSARAGIYSEGYGVMLDYLRGKRPDFRGRGLRVE